jgi:hypothetical protein
MPVTQKEVGRTLPHIPYTKPPMKLHVTPELTEKNGVSMVTFYGIPDSKGNLIRCVKTDDVRPAPENIEMYPFVPEEFEILKGQMQKEYLRNNKIANHTEIEVDIYSGIVWGGCQRTLVCKELGYEHIRAKPSTEIYEDLTPFKRMRHIQLVNIDGKRNEHSAKVKVSVWNGLERSFLAENPSITAMRSSPRGQEIWQEFCISRSTDPKAMGQLLQIFKLAPEFLDEIDNKTMPIGKALKKAKQSIIKPTVKENPNRFDFLDHFDKNPTIFVNMKRGILEAIEQFNSIKILGQELINHPEFGFEYPQLSATYSNIINSTAAYLYSELDPEVTSGRKASGTTGDSRPDIVFNGLSKNGFQEEMIEVKVASLGETAGSSTIYGGPGATNCYKHEYLWCIQSDDGKQIFLMLATIYPEDWEPSGSGKNILTLKRWFDNHFDKKDYRFIIGNISSVGNATKRPNVNFNQDNIEKFYPES